MADGRHLNTLGALTEPFKEPFVQPNQVGPLPTDVPNRLLAWGLFRLPARVTIAPFVEVRDGFTYSAIDDTWTYVGQRDIQRADFGTTYNPTPRDFTFVFELLWGQRH